MSYDNTSRRNQSGYGGRACYDGRPASQAGGFARVARTVPGTDRARSGKHEGAEERQGRGFAS
jgi:hypothetical protein